MKLPTVEEFEAAARSDGPRWTFVPIGDDGYVTTRADAETIARRMRQRESDAKREPHGP